MADQQARSIIFTALGMSQAQIWRYLSEGPSSLSPDQRAKMAKLYPEELEVSPGSSVDLRELKRLFYTWLNTSSAPPQLTDIKAFHLCIYEGVDSFEADLFGCPAYIKDDANWACKWCYQSADRFKFSSDAIEPEWTTVLRLASEWLIAFLRSKNPGAEIMKQMGTITVGFCDGDIHVVWPRDRPKKTITKPNKSL